MKPLLGADHYWDYSKLIWITKDIEFNKIQLN